MGFRTQGEYNSALAGIGALSQRIKAFDSNRWSRGIDNLVEDARRVAFEAVAKAVVNGPDILDMAGGLAKKALGPFAQSWMGAAKGLGGGIAQRFGWMQQATSMFKLPQ